MKYCGVLLLFLFVQGVFSIAHAEDVPRFAVYYGQKEPWESFKNYAVVVFDADRHPSVRPLIGQGADVLAYLSLVEADAGRPYFSRLKKAGLLLPHGKEAPMVVDMRKPQWMQVVIEDILPLYVREGFSGLMLDTVDTAAALEEEDPARYRGMRDAAAMTIRHIRMHYPYLKLMLNRGFEIVPKVGGDVDMVLAESIYSDSRNVPSQLFPEAHYQSVVQLLQEEKARNPNLQVFTLDYWDMKDTQGVKDIYSRQRAAGFIPYVATQDLQTLYSEP